MCVCWYTNNYVTINWKKDALSEKHTNKYETKTKEYQNDSQAAQRAESYNKLSVLGNDGSALR